MLLNQFIQATGASERSALKVSACVCCSDLLSDFLWLFLPRFFFFLLLVLFVGVPGRRPWGCNVAFFACRAVGCVLRLTRRDGEQISNLKFPSMAMGRPNGKTANR